MNEEGGGERAHGMCHGDRHTCDRDSKRARTNTDVSSVRDTAVGPRVAGVLEHIERARNDQVMLVKPTVCAMHSESCCSRGGNRRGVEYEQLGRTGTFIQGQDSKPDLLSSHYGRRRR